VFGVICFLGVFLLISKVRDFDHVSFRGCKHGKFKKAEWKFGCKQKRKEHKKK
jgi:hypothetical protein